MNQNSIALNVIVVGAGLGGHATALALHKFGRKVRIYKRTTTLTEVGAGIQVPPNAARLSHSNGGSINMIGSVANWPSTRSLAYCVCLH